MSIYLNGYEIVFCGLLNLYQPYYVNKLRRREHVHSPNTFGRFGQQSSQAMSPESESTDLL